MITLIVFHFRLAVVFANLGLRYGECIHIIAGNHNYTFLAIFAAWYIGAYCSTGDVELDSDTIGGQVSAQNHMFGFC